MAVSPLTKIGLARAIRDTAKLAQGLTDGDQVIEWAIQVGYLVRGTERETVVMTERGLALAYAYWKAVEESMAARRGDTDNIETLNRHHRPTILLPDGTRIDLGDTVREMEAGGVNPADIRQAIQQEPAPDNTTEPGRSSVETPAVVLSDSEGDNHTMKSADHELEGDS